MKISFDCFLEKYLDAWNTSSLDKLKPLISREYQAREITAGKRNNAEWELTEINRIKIREHEMMAVIIAKLTVDGKSMETCNLFFQTFTYDFEWKLIRSYIEAGIPASQFK